MSRWPKSEQILLTDYDSMQWSKLYLLMMALACTILPLATCHLTLSGRKQRRKGARIQGADTTCTGWQTLYVHTDDRGADTSYTEAREGCRHFMYQRLGCRNFMYRKERCGHFMYKRQRCRHLQQPLVQTLHVKEERLQTLHAHESCRHFMCKRQGCRPKM